MSNKEITQWNLVEVITKADLQEGTVVFLSNDPRAYTVTGEALVWDGQTFPLEQFSDMMERGDGKFAYATYFEGVVNSLVKQEDAFPMAVPEAVAA